MRLRTRLYGLVLCLVLAACDSPPQWMARLVVDPGKVAEGRQYVEDIRTGNFAALLYSVAPEYKDKITLPLLQQVGRAFPAEQPRSVKNVGWYKLTASGTTTYSLTYEYEYSARWLLVNVVFRDAGKASSILGVHLQLLTESVEHMNAFSLTNKPLFHYIFLLAIVAVISTTLVTSWFVWRTPIPRRKWLWMIFVLVGFCGLSLNWATGAVRFQLLEVLLFGASYTQAEYGPPLLVVSFPVGALVYWLRRKGWYEPPLPDLRSL